MARSRNHQRSSYQRRRSHGLRGVRCTNDATQYYHCPHQSEFQLDQAGVDHRLDNTFLGKISIISKHSHIKLLGISISVNVTRFFFHVHQRLMMSFGSGSSQSFSILQMSCRRILGTRTIGAKSPKGSKILLTAAKMVLFESASATFLNLQNASSSQFQY